MHNYLGYSSTHGSEFDAFYGFMFCELKPSARVQVIQDKVRYKTPVLASLVG